MASFETVIYNQRDIDRILKPNLDSLWVTYEFTIVSGKKNQTFKPKNSCFFSLPKWVISQIFKG